MKSTTSRAPWALLVAALAAVPAGAKQPDMPLAADPAFTGKVTRGADGLVLSTDAGCYRLVGEADRALRPLVGRTVKVEGAVDAAAVGTMASLEVLSYIDPRLQNLAGVVGEQDEAPTLDTKDGVLRLGGAPPALLTQLGGRRLEVTGWVFHDAAGKGTEVVLASVAAKVVEDGWLSERIEDPVGSGKWRYRTTALVHPGDKVTLVQLGAYNKGEKAWRTVEDTRPGDILFGVVRIGAPRAGEPALEGWIPIYKLSLGVSVPPAETEAVEAADQVTDTDGTAATQQAPSTGQAGAAQVVEQALGR